MPDKDIGLARRLTWFFNSLLDVACAEPPRTTFRTPSRWLFLTPVKSVE